MDALRFGLAAALFFCAQALENAQVRLHEPPTDEIPAHETERWNPALVTTLSFGQVPAVIDGVWLRLLQDPSLKHVRKGEHPAIYHDLMLVTELDPAFYEAYQAGVNILSIVRDDNPGALDLALRGDEFRRRQLPGYPASFRARFWQQSWSLPFQLAYLYLFEFNDLPHAAEAFIEASTVPGAAPYLAHLAKRLSTRDGQYDVGIGLTQFMIESASDERVRQGLEDKLRDLELSRFLYGINERFSAYRASSKRKSSQPAADDFTRLLRESALPDRDPRGGQLKLGPDGRIITATPHGRVLGMDD